MEHYKLAEIATELLEYTNSCSIFRNSIFRRRRAAIFGKLGGKITAPPGAYTAEGIRGFGKNVYTANPDRRLSTMPFISGASPCGYQFKLGITSEKEQKQK